MAAIIFINIPEAFPLTINCSLWFANTSIFTLLFLAALALYGFRTVLAGRSAFAFDLLKDG